VDARGYQKSTEQSTSGLASAAYSAAQGEAVKRFTATGGSMEKAGLCRYGCLRSGDEAFEVEK